MADRLTERIEQKRAALGKRGRPLSYAKTAEQVGEISRGGLHNITTGNCRPTADTLYRLSLWLGASLDELYLDAQTRRVA